VHVYVSDSSLKAYLLAFCRRKRRSLKMTKKRRRRKSRRRKKARRRRKWNEDLSIETRTWQFREWMMRSESPWSAGQRSLVDGLDTAELSFCDMLTGLTFSRTVTWGQDSVALAPSLSALASASALSDQLSCSSKKVFSGLCLREHAVVFSVSE